MVLRRGLTIDALVAEMDTALRMPGVSNAWTMPIKARTDMLATGIRTPIGIKVYGPDLGGIDRLSREIEAAVRKVPGTTSAFAERVDGGYYLEIEPDRMALARNGLLVGDLQRTISTALGGEVVTTVVDGRARYSVNVRYPRALRSGPDAIASQVLVQGSGTAAVPLGQVARVRVARGPATIRTENAQLVNYIYVDMAGRDLGGYVSEAQRAVADAVQMPPGYYIEWSGQFEYLQRAQAKLAVVVPVTLAIIFVLLYLNFRRMTETLIVMASVPFSLIDGVWLVYWMGFNMSVAVAIGFIALAGVAAETGVIMLIYLDHALADARRACQRQRRDMTPADIRKAIMVGAVERVRPKMMTVTAIVAGLLPILWSTGTGSELMRRIAMPMVGGMVSSAILTLLVVPVIYAIVAERRAGMMRSKVVSPVRVPSQQR